MGDEAGARHEVRVRARGLILGQAGIVGQEWRSRAANKGRQGRGEEAGTTVGWTRVKLEK